MDSQMLSSMNADQKKLIYLMVFEHACKHNMTGILKSALQDDELFTLLQLDTMQSSNICSSLGLPDCKIRPVFFLLLILKDFLHSLENCLSDKMSDMLSWNKKSLVLIIQLLNSTYKQLNFLSLKCFTTLISQLKLLDLIRLLTEDVSSKLIVQKLNMFFPRWTSDLESSIKKTFKLNNSKKMEKIKDSHIQCRRLILRFAASDACRENYVANKCASDLTKFITESILYLKQAIGAIEKNSGRSEIEKLIEECENSFSLSDEPAIQIFLEYLQPNMKEKDFSNLMHALEPSIGSQFDAGFSSCLQPFDVFSDTCSELVSEQGCTDDNYESDSEGSQENSIIERHVALLTTENLKKMEEQAFLETSHGGSAFGTPYVEALAETTLKLTSNNMDVVEGSQGEALRFGSRTYDIYN